MKIILIPLVLFLLFSACSHDDPIPLSGLAFEFLDTSVNEVKEITLSLYLAENTDVPLFPNLKPDVYGRLQVKDLNPGNYIYSHTIVNCSGTCIRVAAFQINPGQNKIIPIPRQGGFGL